MTPGPRKKTDMKIPSDPNFPAGTPKNGAGGWWNAWHNSLQDYRAFSPLHRGVANILFADGGVRTFVDNVEDQQLNNGFPASANNGFSNGEVELDEEAITSIWSLRDGR